MAEITSAAYIAAQHMRVNRKNLLLATHNMAQQSTPGYQADKLMVTKIDTDPNSLKTLGFAVDTLQLRDTKQGDFQYTGSNMDVALNTPDTYLAVQNPDGEVFYTRNGHLGIDTERQLIQTASRFPVLDQNQAPILIPQGATNIEITQDGTLTANGEILTKIGAFGFPPKEFMEKIGDTLLKAGGEGIAVENASFLHKGVEASNVSPILTIAQLMDIQTQDKRDAFVLQTYAEQSRQLIDDILKPINA